MKHRAKLDADSIYWGVEEVEELADGDIEVPQDCDLKPGHYRWNAEHARFDPMPRGSRRDAPEAPLADRALYELLKSLPSVPPYCAAWMDWYKNSFEGSIGK